MTTTHDSDLYLQIRTEPHRVLSCPPEHFIKSVELEFWCGVEEMIAQNDRVAAHLSDAIAAKRRSISGK